MRALLVPGCLAMLPLVVWPGLEHPFTTPQVVWAAGLALALLVWPADRPWRSIPLTLRVSAAAWVATFLVAAFAGDLWTPSAVALGLAAPALALGLVRTGASTQAIVIAQAAGATTCAAVAVLQWAGLDAFGWMGWQPPIAGASVRMRVLGTLGNPNVVGVVMAASLPLTAALRDVLPRRWHGVVAVALCLQALAIVATGSRGAVLGVAAAVSVYALLRWSWRVRIALAALLVFAGVVIAVSPARPLDTTAAGRLHLWRIVAPHVADAPLTGRGPGSVTLTFAQWQREAARDGVRDRRFTGLTDHVHNDYLEALVERGLLGLAALIAPLAIVLSLAMRAERPVERVLAGACAAMAAVAACALVDFPLARPVELTWWWIAFAIVCDRIADRPSPDRPSLDRPTPF